MNGKLLGRLGMPGIVGLGLLMFGVSFHLSSVAPARAELKNLKLELAQLQAREPTLAGGEEGRAEKPEALSVARPFPEWMKALDALARQHGLAIERATYVLSERDGQRRIEISLPFKAGYPALRAFLRDVMLLESSVSLDELTLQRQRASDPMVEATARLSYPVVLP